VGSLSLYLAESPHTFQIPPLGAAKSKFQISSILIKISAFIVANKFRGVHVDITLNTIGQSSKSLTQSIFQWKA
jgi:hypothetical protein